MAGGIVIAGSMACSLFVDLDGLNSGVDTDAALIEASTTDGLADTSSDAINATDSNLGSDGSFDAGPLTPIEFVQGSAVAFGSSDAGTMAITITAAQPGDTLIVATVNDGTATAQITDDHGDLFTAVNGPYGAPHGVRDYIFAAIDVPGGAQLVTISLTGSRPNYVELYVMEYSGIGSFDVGSANLIDAAGTLESGTVMTKAAGELLFAWSECQGTVGLGFGFTSRSTASGDLIEDKIAGAPGVYEATSTTNAAGEILLAAFGPK
ncbi:MAG: hypothetical protein ABI183_07115 [Polyangiaceae bacterium]